MSWPNKLKFTKFYI